MKWIIYLFLLINISFFAWHYQSTEVRAGRETSGYEGEEAITRLVLLSEKQKTESQQPMQWCYSVGPFAEKMKADKAAEALTNMGVDSQLRRSNEAFKKGYWVLLPPAKTREEARKSVAKLKQLKVKDYFLIVSGDEKNGVSLGVFSMFESAHRRIGAMKKLGFEPKLEQVRLPRKEFWLDWPRSTDISLTSKQLDSLKNIAPGLSQIERNCRLGAKPPKNEKI